MLKRVLFTLLITGATLILIGTIAAVVLIKPEKLKAQVLTQLQSRTGYALTAGPASLALGWHGAGIKVHQITATSRDSSIVIGMDDLGAYVKLLPLLHHQVALEHLSLNKPSYVLRKGPPSPAAAQRPPGGHAASLATLGIDSWSINDGSFKQYEPGRGEFSLSGIDLSGGFDWKSKAGFAGNAHGTIKQGVFYAAGRPWPFESLKTDAEFKLSAAADSLTVTGLDLSVAGLKGHLSGGYARRGPAWVGDLRGSVDRASWSKFQNSLTPIAVSLKRFEVAGNVGLPEVHVWRTVNGQNNVEGVVSVNDLSVKMQGAPAGLSGFHGTARFTPETLSMRGGHGVVAGQPLALDLDMTGTAPRKVRAHVVTTLSGAVAGQLIPKSTPLTLASGSLNLDVALERAFPGQGLPTWAGRVRFQGLSGTLNKLPFSGGEGTIAMNGMAADIQSLAMKIGRSDFNIHGTIPDVTQPWLNFSLVSDVLDIDELMNRTEAAGASSASASGKPKRSPLGIAGEGPARVGTLHFKGEDYRQVTGQVRLDEAGITLSNLSGQAYGGLVAGNLRVTPKDGHWAYDGKLTGKDMTAGQVLATWIPRAQIVEGKVNGVVDLSGMAGNGTDARKTLSMVGEATLDAGAFRNFSGLASLSKYINAPELTAERWPIHDLATNFEVRNGAAVFKGLHLTQPGLDWDLIGQVGFDGALALKGTLRAAPDRLKIPAHVAPYTKYLVHSDGRIAIDFKVAGKSSAPSVILDWDDLLAHAAGKLAQDEASNLIQQQIQKALEGKEPKVRAPGDTAKARTDSVRAPLPFPTVADSSLKPVNVFDKLKNLFGPKKTTPAKPSSTEATPSQAKPPSL